jgi:tRNA(Ile)-lysidine synthase
VKSVAGGLESLVTVRPDLVPFGCHVLVAYSGGPDSSALLHLLSRLSTSHRIQVSAAHFDHGLRPESRRIADLCVRRCESAGISCRVGRPAATLPLQHAALRAARYEFLVAEASRVRATRIATGHQADDQAETVLLRIERGTGLRGLSGIPARRGEIVRPLLNLRRHELLRWLSDNGIAFENDPANSDLRWSRARVRHVLLPALEQAMGEDPVPSLLQVADRAGAVEQLMEQAAEVLLSRSRSGGIDPAREEFLRQAWLSEPSPLRAEALRLWARRRGIRLGRGGTRMAVEFITRGRSGGHLHPGGGLRISRSFGTLVFETAKHGVDTTGAGDPGDVDSDLAPSRRTFQKGVELSHGKGKSLARIGDRAFQVRWKSGASGESVPESTGRDSSGRVALAVGPEHFPLRLREWVPGDRIRTRGGTRKLKKLFSEHRLSIEDRMRRPVLVDRSGRVIWVSGVAVADWARAEPMSADLVIEIENA